MDILTLVGIAGLAAILLGVAMIWHGVMHEEEREVKEEDAGVSQRASIAAAYIGSLPDTQANRDAIKRLKKEGR